MARIPGSRELALALALVALLGTGLARAQPQEALDWLRRIQEATRKLSYTGTFVYQHAGRSEISRITRDAAADIERLEFMDGVPREIVRTRDTLRCYLPESKTVKVERRSGEREFPALLPERISGLARHYQVSLGETRRIAGFECRAVILTPRDDLRYGYRLYADVQSGMLLKAVTVDAAGNEVEQFMFTQLQLGGVTRGQVKPRHAARSWKVEDSGAVPATLPGWSLPAEAIPGFRKVAELKRRLGESGPVGQMVFSDGLAAISVFIEPAEARREAVRPGLANLGAIHIFTREHGNHVLTVVGDAPAASVQRLAEGLEYRRPAP